jgi:hypothetical protein
MKFSTIFAGALAAVASAAPTEKRGSLDIAQLNNLQGFNSLDINYLNRINSLDLQLLQSLAVNNNFNALAFQGLFQNNAFNVNQLLQLQQLQTILQLGQLGIFNAFDLSNLNLQILQLGLINNVGAFDLTSLIDGSLIPQITAISQQTGMFHPAANNTHKHTHTHHDETSLTPLAQLLLARSKTLSRGTFTGSVLTGNKRRRCSGGPEQIISLSVLA